MHSWNNSICKTIFKNKNGFLRSGWTILIVMLLYYALLYFASFLVLTALIVILTATGDLNRAADYFSPLANWVNAGGDADPDRCHDDNNSYHSLEMFYKTSFERNGPASFQIHKKRMRSRDDSGYG